MTTELKEMKLRSRKGKTMLKLVAKLSREFEGLYADRERLIGMCEERGQLAEGGLEVAIAFFVLLMRARGRSFEQIGNFMGLSRERIRQIEAEGEEMLERGLSFKRAMDGEIGKVEVGGGWEKRGKKKQDAGLIMKASHGSLGGGSHGDAEERGGLDQEE